MSKDNLTTTNDLIIGGCSAKSLAKEFGTPLYVFDRAYTENMCKVFTSSLNKYYGKGYISYASKAFCCKEIYRIIDKFDMHADVVSYGEMYTAISAGFSPKKLTLHGNNKTAKELEFAITNGISKIVIDSYAEVDLISKICQDHSIVQDVLIRVNPGIEAHTHHYVQTAKIDSKFGFSISNGDAINVIKKVKETPNLNLIGLHCHIGSQIFGSKSFVLAIEKMTDFYAECKSKLNVDFTYLNIGGGFGIYYSGDDKKLTFNDYEEYVKNISQSLSDCVNKKNITKPNLVLEPGRSIVGEAGVTLYSVGSIKEISGVKDYIAIDGGMFENPRYALYQAKYSVVNVSKYNLMSTNKYSIAGKCCESGDLIAEDVSLPKTEVGDILAVKSTGAYNYSMASNYNRNFIPPVVSVYNGQAKVIVRGQTPEDVIQYDL